MSLFYLDSSALVKRYKSERGSNVLDALFGQRTSDDKLATSFMAIIEITALAARLRKGKAITQRRLSEFLAHFNADQLNALELGQISQLIQREAVRIARDHGLRAADSIHLATMNELHYSTQTAGIRLVAVIADKALGDAAMSEGIEVLDPEHDDALSSLRQFIG